MKKPIAKWISSILPIAMLLVFSLVCIRGWYWFVFLAPRGSQSQADKATIVESLFTFLGVLGVVVAIFLQMQELRLQRKELRLTRKELKRSASSQEKSEQALELQARALLLAARLNATNALYQASVDEMRSQTRKAGSSSQVAFSEAIAKMHKVELERLLYELKFVIKGAIPHSIPNQIRQNLPGFVASLVRRVEEFANPDPETGADPDSDSVRRLLDTEKQRLVEFQNTFRESHSPISLMLDDVLLNLDKILLPNSMMGEYGQDDFDELVELLSALKHISKLVGES